MECFNGVLHELFRAPDRSVMPGDAVCRKIRGKTTQRGYCRHVEVTASIQIVGTSHIINGVNSKHLESIGHFSPNLAVCLGAWVGLIKDVDSKLYLSREDAKTTGLDVLDKNKEQDSEIPHHSDNYEEKAFVCPQGLLEEIADWPDPQVKERLKVGTSKSCKSIRVVVKEEISSAKVLWNRRDYSKENSPKSNVPGEDIKKLKLLSVFKPCLLQVGDIHFYVIPASNKNIVKSKPMTTEDEKANEVLANELLFAIPSKSGGEGTFDGLNWNSESSDKESETTNFTSSTASASASPVISYLDPGSRVIVETVSISSTADVVWQDGSVEEGIPSTELSPIHHVDIEEFFPGYFVIENKEGADDACMRVYGVIQSVDHAERTAVVKWLKINASQDCPGPTVLMENEVGVCDLKRHPYFHYLPGTVVFCFVEDACVVGQVLSSCSEGRVRVWWVEGHVSSCWPQYLYINSYDEKALKNTAYQEDATEYNLQPKLAANIEEASLQFSEVVKSLTTEGVQISGVLKNRFGGNSASMSESADNEDSPDDPSPAPQTCGVCDDGAKWCGDELRHRSEVVSSSNSDKIFSSLACLFKGVILKETEERRVLPMKKDCSPHEKGVLSIMDFAPYSHKFKLTFFQPIDTKTFYNRVNEEINLLKSSLPPGTWVTTFEDRMDLFSMMVRGPAGTPYEDGLFFFDLQLSPDYPRTPPLCHFISYCSRTINPNLYEEGRVCLSLLGTWPGSGTENWIPTSNLLQLIVSIQGLILVSEPYFNEPGYEAQKGSQQGNLYSRRYNEMVVIELVQAMTKLIYSPHEVFQEEITSHLKDRANKLCERLESWLDVSNDVVLPEFTLLPASTNFYSTLRKTLVPFRQALAIKNQSNPTFR